MIDVRRSDRARRGIALFGALALLALLGLLVAGAFAASLLDRRAARLTDGDAALTTRADDALQAALSQWIPHRLADLRTGESRGIPIDTFDAAWRSSVSATALRDGVLWMVATVGGVASGESRRANLVARFPLVAYQPEAPLTSNGDVQIGTDVRFVTDSAADVTCARAPTADVVLAPSAAVQVIDSTRAPVSVDHRAAAADPTRYSIVIDSTTRRLMPRVVVVAGDTTIAGGSADSVLLVAAGRIRITGRFVFSGLMIAGRGIEITGSETLLRGAVLAHGAPGTIAARLAGVTIAFAPCITMYALKIAHAPRRVRERSWAELY
jgi:hypothetical protein